MEKPGTHHQGLFWFTFLIAILWIGLNGFGVLDGLKNLLMDARFHYRGPIEAPQKVVYVNRDSDTTAHYGQFLFPRDVYAQVADAVLGLGEAKSVFFDFVLSEYSFKSDAVNKRKLYKDTVALQSVVRNYPNQVVLAALYSDNLENWILQEGHRWNPLAEFLEKRNLEIVPPALNPVPELPMLPLWQPSFKSNGNEIPGWGRIGLINYGVAKSQGAVVRFVPAFVEVENYLPMKWLAKQMARWQELEFSINGLEGLNIETRDRFNEVTGKLEGFSLWDEDFMLQSIDSSRGMTFYTASIMALLGNDTDARMAYAGDYLRIYSGEQLLYEIPLVDGKLIEVNYFSPWISIPDPADLRKLAKAYGQSTEDIFLDDPYNPMVSFLRVVKQYTFYREAELRGDEKTMTEIRSWFLRHFKDTIVLAGPTDPILKDVSPTPFESDNIPLVSVHGNLIKTIVTGRFIHHVPPWVDVMLILFMTLAVSFLAITGGSKALLSKLVAFLVLVSYVFISLTAFKEGDWVVPMVGPVGGALTASIFMIGYQLVAEERQKSRIRNMFGTYVSPELVRQMVESGDEPKLGGHVEEITAFFSDIQNFSSFSEVLEPDALVDLMNEYLDSMTEILEDAGGTLDKYIGDAIVGIFGAPVIFPDHAHEACMVAHRMQLRQIELCERWQETRTEFPKIVHHMRTRIGLNTGVATVGNMGSKKRFNYTMMGDTVNLAARNESGAKSYGVYTMVSESTKIAAEKVGDDCVFRFLDKIVVKGRTQPVSVYEIVGFRKDISEQGWDCLQSYEKGVKAYLARDFEKALSHFKYAEGIEFHQIDGLYVNTNPSNVMVERTRIYLENPPSADWDGRFVMTSK